MLGPLGPYLDPPDIFCGVVAAGKGPKLKNDTKPADGLHWSTLEDSEIPTEDQSGRIHTERDENQNLAVTFP